MEGNKLVFRVNTHVCDNGIAGSIDNLTVSPRSMICSRENTPTSAIVARNVRWMSYASISGIRQRQHTLKPAIQWSSSVVRTLLAMSVIGSQRPDHSSLPPYHNRTNSEVFPRLS